VPLRVTSSYCPPPPSPALANSPAVVPRKFLHGVDRSVGDDGAEVAGLVVVDVEAVEGDIVLIDASAGHGAIQGDAGCWVKSAAGLSRLAIGNSFRNCTWKLLPTVASLVSTVTP